MSGGAHVFRLPKAGNSEADYEDAFAIGEDCVAIADGATESSFARAWAEALVQGFVSSDSSDPKEEAGGEAEEDAAAKIAAIQQRVVPLQQAWHERIAWDRLPWFAEDKARSGAFATLLTFRFGSPMNVHTSEQEGDGSAAGRWQAWAIGDSCLFHIRKDALLTAFPLERAEDFNSRPVLLSSNPANNERVWESVLFREGDYRPGDVFLFATDALAHWIQLAAETGEKPWHDLCELQSHAEFTALAAKLRQDHAMRNDDVTLVRIIIPDGTGTSPEADCEQKADKVSPDSEDEA